jgi:hypothetical protein
VKSEFKFITFMPIQLLLNNHLFQRLRFIIRSKVINLINISTHGFVQILPHQVKPIT